MTPAASIDRYVAFFESIEPGRLGELRNLCHPEVRFIDPFNDLVGVERMIAVFEQMYADVADPRFRIQHRALEGTSGYLRWAFSGHPRNGGARFQIEGVSLIELDEAGRVTLHRDFWDPAGSIYQRIPLLGSVLRLIRKRLAVDP